MGDPALRTNRVGELPPFSPTIFDGFPRWRQPPSPVSLADGSPPEIQLQSRFRPVAFETTMQGEGKVFCSIQHETVRWRVAFLGEDACDDDQFVFEACPT